MKLSIEEIEKRLLALPEWNLSGQKLHREYKFPDFALAIGFLAASAPAIEKLDHHPEWSNVYGRVSMLLTTHDAGGLSQRDIKLARKVSALSFRSE